MTESPYDPVAVQSMLDKIPAITIEHCAETIVERDCLKKEVVKLQSALDLCVKALEEVEWLQDHNSYDYCPWCQEYVTLGNAPKHADDCGRQGALAAVQGEDND